MCAGDYTREDKKCGDRLCIIRITVVFAQHSHYYGGLCTILVLTDFSGQGTDQNKQRNPQFFPLWKIIQSLCHCILPSMMSTRSLAFLKCCMFHLQFLQSRLTNLCGKPFCLSRWISSRKFGCQQRVIVDLDHIHVVLLQVLFWVWHLSEIQIHRLALLQHILQKEALI